MSKEKKRVLIIDDSSDDIQVVMENLIDDYAVTFKTSGPEGVEAAAKEPKPDVILLDVVMPEMDGYETCRKLKHNETTKDIDIIFVSAMDTVEEKLSGYDAGASDYLTKPVQPEELIRKVRLAISNRQKWESALADKSAAFDTAMTAMTSAGEQGVVLEFFRKMAGINSAQELARLIVDAIANYQLENSVQIRSSSATLNAGTIEPVPPLEEELLMRMHAQGRIMELSKRAVFNFGAISLLIKNMPDDADKRGRLRDHIAILLEGAESKLAALEMHEQLTQIINDSKEALQAMELAQKRHKLASQDLVDGMLRKLEASFMSWDLSEEQEQQLLEVVQTAVTESLDLLHHGMALDEKMGDIFDRLLRLV